MTTHLLLLTLLLPLADPPKKCTGQVPCPACTTCSRCKHCKVAGGTCGACQHPDDMVVRIIDGDTIVVQVKGHPETVRLIGVDTPENQERANCPVFRQGGQPIHDQPTQGAASPAGDPGQSDQPRQIRPATGLCLQRERQPTDQQGDHQAGVWSCVRQVPLRSG